MPEALAAVTSRDLGALGILHLRRMWARTRLTVQGSAVEKADEEWLLDNLVFDGLGLGLEPTIQFLHGGAASYEDFERWILEQGDGGLDPARRERINRAIRAVLDPEVVGPTLETLNNHPEPVLSQEDLAHFEAHGYVVLKNAVPTGGAAAAAQAVWDHLGASPDDVESWYRPKVAQQKIMVQLFQHPALEANRQSPRIHRAFAQLWQTEKLWVTTDRVSFNPPERHDYRFPGPDLHWDAYFTIPFAFGLQGVLYLTDTEAEQGAFTCVPGFHHRIDAWLAALPKGSDPQMQDLHALGPKPIPGKGGDMVIWHHGLPHGSRPNRASVPRLVQYIKLYPVHHVGL
ncbi:MAG: phytanoyl-CoA dioxygenase [Alphaproteobacteria bacterium CG_4_10_14_0_2_um_filter_63_37]|nr:MAG: hypothetical protein AUJ55_12130 [Proteobacteria bacterium CG1_02_64_396]PJA25716.1 MAG: phytanoyl-CoA dioxygenase [Alphaproteobacteria bacterium CG_4_10_14_0_2_um_filter_63_37]